ncbi:hypothetical protein ABZ714_21955 [Streptomyces sp. NPDC006798]|uniref:hypothetical protein n=1 Tax=Streptomyces sp. NPDC006798 TaxID=3155462 RepID=UPI0033F3046A
MSSAVPLPSEQIPEDAAAWRSADAGRWSAAGPGQWAHPLLSVLVLVAALVWSVASTPDEPCTAARPCDTSWDELTAFALALLAAFWIVRAPRIALAPTAGFTFWSAAAALGLFPPAPQPFRVAPDAAAAAYLAPAAAAFVTAALTARIVADRRRRAVVEAAAGPGRHRLPPDVPDPRRGLLRSALAPVLLAATAFALWQSSQAVDAYERRAATATRVTAEVAAADADPDDLGRLTAVGPDGRRYALDTVFPEYYPVGSEVELVVDGDWVRLVSEPYDLFDWELTALLTVLPGLALLTEGLTGLRRFHRRRRDAFPVLRVHVRPDRDGRRIRVFAADDPAAARPLFLLRPGRLESFGSGGRRLTEGPAWEVREGVLYGVPLPGADTALVATGASGVFSTAPAGPSAYGPGRTRERTRERARRNRHTGRPVAEVAAELAAGPVPPAEPRIWTADPVSRVVGGFFLLICSVGSVPRLGSEVSLSWVLALLAFPVFATLAATALNWRISAGRTGVRLAGAWRVRHVPWDEITGIRHVDDSVYVERTAGGELRLGPVGFRPVQKRLGTPSSAHRAADELRALWHRPELRPVRDPDGDGLRLGPPLVLIGAAVIVALRLL